MSGTNTSGEGQKTEGEGQKVDVTKLTERIEQLENSYNRVLEESKGHKSKANEYKQKLDEIEKKKIDESGDTEAKLKYEREQREKLESDNKKLKGQTLDNNIRDKVKKFAKDVHSIDDLLNQPGFAHILKAGIDQEKLTLSDEAAKDFVNKVLEAKPWLKKNIHQPGVDGGKPNGGNPIEKKDYSGMKSSEIMADIKKNHKPK